MENEFIIDLPVLSFKEWMEALEFSERTIQSRLSNLAKLEECYEPLKDLWRKDRFKDLLAELAYSSEDRRNNVVPSVQIPVSGKVYEGLATYRSTLRLYDRYLQYVQNISAYPFGKVGKAVDDAINRLRATLIGCHSKYTQKQVKTLIIEPLIVSLEQALLKDGYTFGTELTTSKSGDDSTTTKDRYDIIGTCADNTNLPTIIIEVDTHRSDQVSKKVVSRIALNSGSKLLYIALVYPNNHTQKEAEKRECAKYFLFIGTLFNELRPPEKKFKGYYLY
ncbi:MAG: hypothetical protein HDT06_03640 [Bacteroidales bacterium]|nr:hypothetical protein [Bacteroidales bacterium]